MSKHVTIKATFKDKDHYRANHADNIRFVYFDDEQPLNVEDAAKMERITAFYLENNIFPSFLIVNESEPLEGEAFIDLHKWTNDGKPRFTMKVTDGRIIPASGNGGGRPVKTSLATSS